ncbi:hypothetical protein ACMGG8_20920 [Pseudomonas sp. BNK-45]|uniref:hypothetical protein n=1 Tax=unclassified Pseudomonas TaxID=196821 RepID=UPI001F2A9811|nr:hypothetical protein [Pseudomonas sp. BC42]ULT68154.1 hypothetical protein L1O02_17205 [Pseudomonas sp. BC42]
MTRLVQWSAMPHQLALNCPQCGAQARFDFVVSRPIARKVDVPFFADHPLLDYRQEQDSCGHYRHYALYFPGLHGDPTHSLGPLPEGYLASHWQCSPYWYRDHGLDLGSLACEHCRYSARHTLNWPSEAYFSVAYKGQMLWAFNRESALALHDYLESAQRDPGGYPWRSFLLHIPGAFKHRKARQPLTRLLKRLLMPG